MIKVMNLVALLIAPVIVEQADSTGVRIAVSVAAALVIAGAIWVSKHRRSELTVADAEPTKEGAAV
jgi:uncharacterized membrane protein (UPF0136 family)